MNLVQLTFNFKRKAITEHFLLLLRRNNEEMLIVRDNNLSELLKFQVRFVTTTITCQ